MLAAALGGGGPERWPARCRRDQRQPRSRGADRASGQQPAVLSDNCGALGAPRASSTPPSIAVRETATRAPLGSPLPLAARGATPTWSRSASVPAEPGEPVPTDGRPGRRERPATSCVSRPAAAPQRAHADLNAPNELGHLGRDERAAETASPSAAPPRGSRQPQRPRRARPHGPR